MTLFIIVALIIAYFVLWGKVSALEDEVKRMARGGQSAHGTTPSPTSPTYEGVYGTNAVPMYGENQETTPVPLPQYERHPDAGNQFMEWLRQDLLMKIGALVLLMGIGWFVGYAFIQGWIGEAGRITLGLVFGASVLVLGVWRIKTHEHQGAIFTVLGSTIVLITVSAARTLYNMFDPYSALAIVLLSVGFVAFVSLRYNRNSLALTSLILAAIAPLFTAHSYGFVEHMLYLLIIVLGTLWVVYHTGWRNLTFTALIIVFFGTAPYMHGYGTGSHEYVALLWVFVFTAIFFVANIVSLLRQRGGITSITNLFTALGTAVLLVLWVFTTVPESVQSLLFVMWALVFGVGAYLVYRTTDVRSPFYVYGGTGIALIAAATGAELHGAVLTIAYTFEIAVLVYAGIILGLERSIVQSLTILFAVPILMSLESFGASEWYSGVLHEHFFTILTLGLVFSIIGAFIEERYPRGEKGGVHAGGVLITIGVIYGLVLLWLITHAVMDADIATTLTLIIYTVLGLVSYFSGRNSGAHAVQVGGGVLLGFVLTRLFLIDVWAMPLSGRVITFITIGVLLLGTAFLGRRQKRTELSN